MRPCFIVCIVIKFCILKPLTRPLFTAPAVGEEQLPGPPEGPAAPGAVRGPRLLQRADLPAVLPGVRLPGGRGLPRALLQLVRGQQLQGVPGGQRQQEPRLQIRHHHQ